MNMTNISGFKLGNLIKGFYICIEKNLKKTKHDNLYIDIELLDSTGIIECKIWDLVDIYQDRFTKQDPVAVKG